MTRNPHVAEPLRSIVNAFSPRVPSMPEPRITDNDHGEITAIVAGKPVRGWSYKDDAERRVKMLMAHEFAEGWFQATRPITTGTAEDPF